MKSINNIFEMVKADRYTADGREEIIKAQEAETKDARRYKPGEISEATGLQKQPDGSWDLPTSTKYGKVTTNKEGKVGIQQTLGKGSKFEEFANEKSASRALANLTAGYNTTERSKEDPHSDKARQVKHWDKETEQIKKENKAERRAAHAAHFQNEAGAPAGTKQEKGLTRQDNTIFKGNDARELNSNVQSAAGGERDISAENRAYHEKVEKERAERETRANNQASKARQEAEARHLSGVEMKDFFLAKAYEGASVEMTQRGLEAQGFDLLEANDKVNVYERPEGGRITMQLEGNKIKSAEYQTPAETAREARSERANPAGAKQEEIGKFYTKFDDVQGAYDAGRQTFPEGGYTIFKTPTGQYKVVDDPKTKQRMTEAGYQVEVDVPKGTKPPKSPGQKDSAPLTGDTKIKVKK